MGYFLDGSNLTISSRLQKKSCRTIHFGLGYNSKDGGGFSKQVTLDQPTSSFEKIYQTCLDIFHEAYDGSLIRTVYVSLSKLTENTHYQFNLFEDYDAINREHQLLSAIDTIKEKFGKNAVNRASSLNKESTIVKRNGFIGGHQS